MEGKRLISLGFRAPPTLEGNIIYVNYSLSLNGKALTARAVSQENFTYHDRAIAGNLLTLSGKEHGTLTGSVSSGWHRDTKEFLSDLVTSNNGEISYERLAPEGALAFYALDSIKAAVE